MTCELCEKRRATHEPVITKERGTAFQLRCCAHCTLFLLGVLP